MANTKAPSSPAVRTQDIQGVVGFGRYQNTASDYSGGEARAFHVTTTAISAASATFTSFHLIDQPMRLVGAVAVGAATDFAAGIEVNIGLATDSLEFCTGVALTTGQPGVLQVLSGSSTADFGGGTTVSAGDILAVEITGGATTNGIFALTVFAVPRNG